MAGTVVGGIVFAALLALPARAAVEHTSVSLVALFYAGLPIVVYSAGLELGGTMGRLPERRAQVPRRWLLWRRRNATATAFGLMLGTGALTYLRHATAYALAVAVVLAPTLPAAMAAGGLYGLGRGSTLGLTWATDRWMRRRLRWERIIGSRPGVRVGLAASSLATFLLLGAQYV